jgi:hypothetical protein
MLKKINLGLIFLVFFFSSCEKGFLFFDDNSKTNGGSNTGIATGEWIISFYFDRNKNETSDYSGFSFDFGEDGVLSANSSEGNYEGAWRKGSDDSKEKLIISFASPERLKEMSDDWEILTESDDLIKLKHKSGGDGHESFLTFERK